MSEAKSVDAVLVQHMNDQMADMQNNVPPVESLPQEPVSQNLDVPRETLQEDNEYSEEHVQETPKNEDVSRESSSQKNDDQLIDEYGNPIGKSKLYTEDEVNNMIRDRLSRGRFAEQYSETPRQMPKTKVVNEEELSGEDGSYWQEQLNQHIDNRIEERQRERAHREWQSQEMAKQEAFQEKFTSGMNRYSDFREVVSNKPITDNMMLAIRNLENPAAFVYGASKLHPQELDRIARIPDPYAQASEMGRLHERMVKERKTAANATRPLESPKSDMPSKINTRPSLETLIDQHARQKQARR